MTLDGALTIIIEDIENCSLNIRDSVISNEGWYFVETADEEGEDDPNDKVRGYKLLKNDDGLVIHLRGKGKFEYSDAGGVKRLYPGFDSKELELGVQF